MSRRSATLTLAAILACALAVACAAGCRASPNVEPGANDGAVAPGSGAVPGGSGQSPGGQRPPRFSIIGNGRWSDEGPSFVWDSFLATLPELGFRGYYYNYNSAVVRALQELYADDAHVSMTCGSFEDLSDHRFYYTWGRFPEELSLPQDPAESETAFYVEFEFEPAAPEVSAYAVAQRIYGSESLRWDAEAPPAEAVDSRSRVLGAAVTIWRAAVGRYEPVGDTFWCAFRALHQLALVGWLFEGPWDLPGEHGAGVRLLLTGYMGVGYCHLGVVVTPLPPADADAGAGPAGDWEAAIEQLPPPSFGDGLMPFFHSLARALEGRDASATADAPPGSLTLYEVPARPDLPEIELRWFRPCSPSAGPGYSLERLALRLTPCASGTASSSGSGFSGLPGPGEAPAQSIEVTEFLAWGAYSGAPADTAPVEETLDPSARSRLQALADARDVVLERYLPLGSGFSDVLAGLQLTQGFEAELPGRDDTRITLTVNEVWEDQGVIMVRYTLTRATGSGG